MKPALIVFAKAPVAGEVKTRLTTHLSDEEAADLYRAFLEDSLHQYAALPLDVRLYVPPPAELIGVDVPAGTTLHVQQGKDLGSRMAGAFVEAFAEGYERVAIVGSDHPTLPPGFIAQALGALAERRSIVIGPAEDGGYYLLGMNDFYPQVFAGMEYSHSRVFLDTLEKARESAAQVTVLPEWYDVDSIDALRHLALDVLSDDSLTPRTAGILRALAQRHDWLAS